jgi:CheY-like chemotaxis protein
MSVTRTILLVDDEPDFVANCERLLRRVGHVSLRAYTGIEALTLIDLEGPDLVVTDRT